MPPKTDPVEDYIKILSDKRVQDLIGTIIETRIKDCLSEIDSLRRENQEQNQQIAVLKQDLSHALNQINALEAYNRRDNVVITGLPVASYAEAASFPTTDSREREMEHAAVTEQSVLKLCQELQVPIAASDISIAHRLKKKPKDQGPPAVIVRFTNRKAREMVFAARLKLKRRQGPPIFINEDLTKCTADLFFKARRLVKDGIIYSAWTSSGTVYIKKTNDLSCHPTRILSTNDLPSRG